MVHCNTAVVLEENRNFFDHYGEGELGEYEAKMDECKDRGG